MSLRRRLRFWRDAVMAGARPFKGLAGLITLAVGGSALVAVTRLANLGLVWLAAAALALFLIVYAEGSYRVWALTDDDRQGALRALEDEASLDALLRRLHGSRRELVLLSEEIAHLPDGSSNAWESCRIAHNDISARVGRELRLHAPGFLPLWRTGFPEGDPAIAPEDAAGFDKYIDLSRNQLDQITTAIKAGKTQP